MKRAALYARVSTDLQQKEGTIESQVVTLRRQITAAGQELVREYIDDGYTGTLLTRPGLEQLRSDLKADVFDVVHFLAADRIARDAAYQSIIVGELISHGKQIIINGVNYENIPESKVTLRILGAVAEFERAKIIERMMRGKLHRLQKGEMIGGQAPFGYEHVCRTAERPATLALKEPDASIVRRIFEMIDHVQRVIYLRDKVTLIGSVPVQRGTHQAPVPAPFRMEGELNRKAIRARPHILQPDDGRWKKLPKVKQDTETSTAIETR